MEIERPSFAFSSQKKVVGALPDKEFVARRSVLT